MRVISILNFKGGTGKSSVAENLSHALARQGYKVLVIDGDRQSNSTTTLLGERKTPSLSDVITGKATLQDAMKEARPNLFVVPSDTDLDKVGVYLTANRRAYYTVRKALQALDNMHLVLIDHAGAYSPVMEALLLASTHVLIPCELEPYSVQGLLDMFDKLASQLEDHELENAGIIPYNVDLRYAMSNLYLNELKAEFENLITSPVRTDATVPRSQSMQQTVFEYDPRSNAAKDFMTLSQLFVPGE